LDFVTMSRYGDAMTTLREADRRALLRLLADEDATVVQLLQTSLTEMGCEGIAFLESATREGDPGARRNARHILLAIRVQQATEAFAKFCGTRGAGFDLERGCWLLAKTRYPELDEAPYRTRLDEMARELKERLTGRETPRATVEVCNRYFFRRLGFRGNREDYYDPDNTYLNRVLDRRLGIPISLSVLYLLVGRRLKLPMQGVNVPGHFLLRWPGARGSLFIDAFNEGAPLSLEDCKKLSDRLGQVFDPMQLEPATPRQILLRMCRNLEGIYRESDPARADQFGHCTALLARG
jgi:regulator of sirC expression with transglutaminase-like and TPR domain